LADGQTCLSIQSLHNFSPCSSAASLLLTIGPLMRLISTIEPSRPERKIMPCESQSNPVANLGNADPAIKEAPVTLHSPLPSHGLTVLKILSGVNINQAHVQLSRV